MANAADVAALAFRSVPRDELLARLRDDTDQLLREFEAVSDAEWSGRLISDPYLGPLPVMIIAAGMLDGATVHAWDVRQGLGMAHALAGDAADLRVATAFRSLFVAI